MKKIVVYAYALGLGGTEKALIGFLKAINYKKYNVSLRLLEYDDYLRNDIPVEVDVQLVKFKREYDRAVISWSSETVLDKRNIIGRIKRKVLHLINDSKPYGLYKIYCYANSLVVKDIEHYDLAVDFHGYGYYLTEYIANCVHADKKVMFLHDEDISWLGGVKPCLAQYDRFLCVSKAVKSAFEKQYSSLRNRAELFYNIIDINEIKKKAEEKIKDNYFDTENFKILTVGRLENQKGYDLVIQIARELKNRGINFCWYIIGSGREESNLRKMIEENNLKDICILLGRKRNPLPYVVKCDLYIQPSCHEGYGITVLEAKVLCKPIIATKIKAFEEQIKDNENGFLVDFNKNAFADKIQWIMNNEQKRLIVMEQLKIEKIDFSGEIEKIYRLIN